MHVLVITCRNIFNNDDRKVYTRFQIFSNEHVFLKFIFKVKCKIQRKGPVNEN